MTGVHPPRPPDWIALTADSLPVAEALQWVVVPDAGAVVSFLGTVRDHAEDRSGVTAITYEAYEEAAVAALVRLAAEARERWADLGRIVLWHRTGRVPLGEASVAVLVSAPHRAPAFEAGRYLIDALKETVPIWKREHWAGGSGWARSARPIRSRPPRAPAAPRPGTG
jgi:molybdopterin synthase catalytic subunit